LSLGISLMDANSSASQHGEGITVADGSTSRRPVPEHLLPGSTFAQTASHELLDTPRSEALEHRRAQNTTAPAARNTRSGTGHG
jgi:hypothetical protein